MTDSHIAIWLMLALITKHFIWDFLLQTPYMYLNKGTYGHWGGIIHAGQHAYITICILICMNIGVIPALICGIGEGIIHYHIDWAKVNICRKYDWKCNTSEKYWYLLGLDQFLHYLTYVGILYIISA